MVTGDGHGYREFRGRPFGHRELAPGFRRLKAERLAPERLTTVAVTRHLRMNNIADAMSSHPYRTADFDTLTVDIGHIGGLRIGWRVS
jgi:hypothetical protein